MAYVQTLLQGKNKNNGEYENFPHELMVASSFKISPNKRIELKAYRDNDVLLHRKTSPNFKTELSFETFAMNDSDLVKIRTWLAKCTTVSRERRCSLKAFDPETGDYVVGDFYLTDPEFTIRKIETKVNGTIYYDRITWNFIQY